MPTSMEAPHYLEPIVALLEEVRLLHDAEELFLVHLTVTVTISLINHFLQFLISHTLTELLGDTLQVFEGDFSSLIVIEKAEGLQDLIFRVAIQDLVCHHFQELFVFDGATAVIIDI